MTNRTPPRFVLDDSISGMVMSTYDTLFIELVSR
jgi:hypothetical protein